MRPTCASSGNSLALLGLAPPGSAVSTDPAGMSSSGNHPAPRAVSFLLRCRPSRDPRLRGAGCPMEGGLSSGRDTYGFPFQPLPFWNLGPQVSTSRGRPRALGRINKGEEYLSILENSRAVPLLRVVPRFIYRDAHFLLFIKTGGSVDSHISGHSPGCISSLQESHR